MMTVQELSQKILEHLGGKENIVSAINCMTRLRVDLADYEKADIEALKGTEGVIQVLKMDNLHVVLGPGKAKKVTEQFRIDAGLVSGEKKEVTWQEQKAAIRATQKQNRVKKMMRSVGEIFIPLLPGVIAAGICAGCASIISTFVPNYSETPWLNVLYQLLNMIYAAFMTLINAWAGYRAAEKFGATPILGGMLGALTSMEGINIIAQNIGLWVAEGADPLNAVLRSGRGGVLAVILGALLMSKIEKWVRDWMPSSLDIVGSSLVIMLISAIPYVLIIMPLAGLISSGLVSVVGAFSMSENIFVRMIAGYISAFLFLPMVAVGMHHGLVALYSVQLTTLGFVTLYPALNMGGAGQIGAAIAVWIKARKVGNKRLTRVIAGALPAGVLGIGEPLIYSVTMPLGKTMLTACLGSGFGGAFCMAMRVASISWGPSGILALPIMTAGVNPPAVQMMYFGMALLISYTMGFIITNFVLKSSEVEDA